MFTSRRFSSNKNFNKIGETRGNITVEAGYLSVSERNFDQQTHFFHSNYQLLQILIDVWSESQKLMIVMQT